MHGRNHQHTIFNKILPLISPQSGLTKLKHPIHRRNLSQHHCELIQAAWRLSSRRAPEYYPGHPSPEAIALNERAKIMYNTDLLTRYDTQKPNIPPDRVPNFSYCLSAREVITGIYRTGDVYITNDKDIQFITSAFSDNIIQKRKLLKYIVMRTKNTTRIRNGQHMDVNF